MCGGVSWREGRRYRLWFLVVDGHCSCHGRRYGRCGGGASPGVGETRPGLMPCFLENCKTLLGAFSLGPPGIGQVEEPFVGEVYSLYYTFQQPSGVDDVLRFISVEIGQVGVLQLA